MTYLSSVSVHLKEYRSLCVCVWSSASAGLIAVILMLLSKRIKCIRTKWCCKNAVSVSWIKVTWSLLLPLRHCPWLLVPYSVVQGTVTYLCKLWPDGHKWFSVCSTLLLNTTSHVAQVTAAWLCYTPCNLCFQNTNPKVLLPCSISSLSDTLLNIIQEQTHTVDHYSYGNDWLLYTVYSWQQGSRRVIFLHKENNGLLHNFLNKFDQAVGTL